MEPAFWLGGGNLAHQAIVGDGTILVDDRTRLDVLHVAYNVGAFVVRPWQIVHAACAVRGVRLGDHTGGGIVACACDGAHDERAIQIA